MLGTYLEHLLISFWRFLPGVLLCWIAALAAPNGLALYGLLIVIVLPVYCTGASKALGHYPGGEGAGKQLGLMLSLLVLPVVLFVVALLLMLPLSHWIETYTSALAAMGISLLLCGLFMFRLWPAYAAAFITGMPVEQRDWTWGSRETMQVMKASWRLTASGHGQRRHGALALPALVILYSMPLPLAFHHSVDGNSWSWWLAYLGMALLVYPLAHLIIIDQAQQLVNDPDSPDLRLEARKLEAANKIGDTREERKDLKTFLDHVPDYLLKDDQALADHLQAREQERISSEIRRSAKRQMIHAIEKGDLEWLEQAMSRGVQPDGCDKNGRPYFIHAVEYGRLAIMTRLLEMGVDVDIRSEHDRTGLSLAIGYGKVHVAEFLLHHGASLDEMPRLQPALHLACSTKHVQMVKYLVGRGLSIEQPTDDMRPLDFAISNRRLDTVEYLIGLGADVHHACRYNGSTHTSLTLAVWGRSVDIVERLIRAGADPSAAPPGGNPPLIEAAGNVDLAVVTLLLESGADADAPAQQGYDAAVCAEYQERALADEIAEVARLIRSYQK